jgi:iron complex outermembrane receptor protein
LRRNPRPDRQGEAVLLRARCRWRGALFELLPGGSKTSYTGSLQWKPVHDLLFRGSYAKGFRAPSIGELFGAQSRADAPINDPCTNVPGSPYQTSAVVRTNCTANGVPASGSYQEPVGGQLGVLTGGNTALKLGNLRRLLFGGVYSPTWVCDTKSR